MSVHAYVLVQTSVGKASAVVKAIREIEGIDVAEYVTGPYDVIAQAQADTVDELGRLVVSQVQAVEGITRTVTCSVVNL